MVYNLTNFSEANNVLDLAVATNELTGGYYMLIILSLVWIISFITLKNYDTKSAFVTSSFVTFVLGGVLFVAGLVSETVIVVFFVLFLLSVGIMFFTD